MKKIQLYVIREFIPPFLLSVGIFTFIMLLDKILDLLDMIVSKGVPIRTVAEVFFLLLPSIMAVVIPMAVLAAVLMAIGRMSGDLEVTAMKASGISIFALIRPLMITAAVLCGIMIYFNNEILPDANHFAKNLMLDIGQMTPSAKIVPGVFVDDIDYYRILVGGKDDITGELTDVLIHENIPGKQIKTITAISGELDPISANRFRLVLRDGEMHQMYDDTTYMHIEFETYCLLLTRSGELTRQERDNRGDRELSAYQMESLVDSLRIEVAILL
ncbi:MAG: LptF/LptG family permease, partial [FCB group bacterium]|nr:LptF/LptG family permease [FCB group bacterium]